MKTPKIIFLLVLLLFSTPTVPAQTQTNSDSYRLIVSFMSKCCGIDQQAKERLDIWLSAYEKKKKVKLDRKETHWGKEGEIDYCLKLTELSVEDQKSFVYVVSSLLSKVKLVSLQENSPCKKDH